DLLPRAKWTHEVPGGGRITSMACGPDGAIAVCFNKDDSSGIMICDATGRLRTERPLEVPEVAVDGSGISPILAFSPDSSTLATGFQVRETIRFKQKGAVLLWDAAGQRRANERELGATQEAVASVAFSPDGRALAAGFIGTGTYGFERWDVMSR